MGKSSGQVTGYKYLANFLLFIGNPIEKLLNINFDKRGWIANERISYGSNGEMIYIEKPNLYGENEGGVAGTMRVKHGTNKQTASTQYKKYMASLALPTSAYPYQSYIIFGGGGFSQGSWDLTEEELEDVGDDLDASNKNLESGFYLGNSGYMKEMLLWPKRTRIRNDGREQWYGINTKNQVVCEIGAMLNGLSPKEYKDKVNNLPALTNEWFGTDNEDNQFHVFMNGNQPYLGLIKGVVWDFHSQFGYLGKTGTVKTTFPADLQGLSIKLTIFADDGITGFMWTGGEHSINRVFSESGYPDCKEYILLCKNLPLHLEFNITDGVNGGSNSNHKCVIFSEIPDFGGYGVIDGLDINPIHKIREILTDDTAMNKPESDVNDINFRKAADRIFDEGLGISWAITEKSCLDAINELCGHIEAGVRVNRQTGLYEMVLFRDDWFSDDEIHTLAVNKIKSMSLDVSNADEAINQLNVSYYKSPWTKIP
jgi:hypothetical protein